MPCRKCSLLAELFENTTKTNRDYWLMTELFVILHDGSDICTCVEIFGNIPEEENHVDCLKR